MCERLINSDSVAMQLSVGCSLFHAVPCDCVTCVTDD